MPKSKFAVNVFLTLVLLVSSAHGRSSFQQKIKQHADAHNTAFHADLLKQLADIRSNSASATINSPFSHETNNVNNSSFHLLEPVDLASPVTFAINSTDSFQIYTDDSLPTLPAPSGECVSALTATIPCNSTIPLMAISPYMFMDDLSTVCTMDCTIGLDSYRAGVVSACSGYAISGSGNTSYAPTLAVDYIRGSYNVQCLQDPDTGDLCGPMILSFNATGGLLSLPTNELCSYCMLQTLNITLSNPTTFSAPVADLLSSAIDMCGPQYDKYNVSTTPENQVVFDPGAPSFGANLTTGPTVDCALTGRNITIDSTTTCADIAAQYNVSEYDVLSCNTALSVDCNITAGMALCIPQGCTTYTIATNDTCDTVSAMAGGITGHNITSAQLQSFNPDMGTYCQLMALRVGKRICLSPNGGWPNVGAASPGNPSSTPTEAAPVPSPTVSGTTPNCGRYYQVQEGDICQTVALANGVSLLDFIKLNPEINTNCTNLWLNYYYCVAPYPPFASITPSPTMTFNYSSATIFSYSIPTNYTLSYHTTTLTAAGVAAPTNVADGTRTVACGSYYDIQVGDTLDSVSTLVGVNVSLLTSWNPELSSGALPSVGSAICIIFPKGSYTLAPAARPNNVYGNATSACAEYYTVQSGDGCSSIETKFALTNAQFDALNPGLSPGCTNLVLGLAYCVFPVKPFPAPSGSGPPGNVAPGTITDGCTSYYTVASGNSCGTIEGRFNVTSSEFSAWNPEIASDCSNLQLGLAYCVAGPAPSGPPSNAAPGTITDGCTNYYTIVSGDSCSAIEGKFSITSTQFSTWNPEILANCSNLQIGLAYCVASSKTGSGGGGSGPPSNLARGSLSNCSTYHTVVSGDNCPSMETTYKIAAMDLFRWNPEVSSDCTNILAGDAYCVGGGGNACKKVYTVQSGDFCFAITQSQGITQAQLNAFNSFLDAKCDLILGENLCVG